MRSRHILVALALMMFPSLIACGDDSEGMFASFNPLPDPEPGNWTSFRADPERTGYNPDANTGRTVRELWRVPGINTTEYGAAKGSPSVYGDILGVVPDCSCQGTSRQVFR